MSVYDEIRMERQRQDEKWGGPEHDDEHRPADWKRLLERRLRMAENAYLEANAHLHRYRLVQVAALAVAALEAHDRFMRRTGLAATGGEGDA